MQSETMQAIVNVNPEWGIGSENRLLVHIRADMRRFKTMTTGNTVIVGRITLETFPGGKPLANRKNIVLTRDPDFCCEDAIVCHDLAELRCALFETDPESVFVCGGEQIYRQLLPYCSSAFVTLTDTDAKADRFFPNLNLLPNWVLTESGEKQDEKGVAFRFLTYTNTETKELWK